MARTRESEAETLEQRVKRLIEHSHGTMPICMLVKTEDEAGQALELLAKNRKAAELISVQIDGTDQEITVADWNRASDKRKSRAPDRRKPTSPAVPRRGRRR